MRKYLQKVLIRFIIKDVFHSITVDDILAKKNGKMTWKGEELSDEVVGKLKVQASNLSTSLLWKILKAEIQWIAAKTLLEKGKTDTDVRMAQMQGYITNIINNKLSEISNGSQ